MSQLAPRTRGANYPAVTDRDVLSVVVPIVEHEVQDRVVEQIDAMMAEVEEARALASAIRRDTERLMEAAIEEVLGSLGTTKFGLLVSDYKNGIYKPSTITVGDTQVHACSTLRMGGLTLRTRHF